MIKIVADDKIPFLRGALDKHAGVVYLPGREISKEIVADADALIVRTRTACDRKLLEGSLVKYIATATIGFDHIDAEYCRSNGIGWSNAPGCNSGSVMQYMATAIATIACLKKMRFSDMKLGIVGVGNVGSRVERLARLLGMRVMLNDPPRCRTEGAGEFDDLDRLLAGSDIVSMHVPLNREGRDKTVHMAGAGFFEKMKKGAWFVNTSRGEIMQTVALKGSLKSGQLAGCVIDVWENEPEIDRELLNLADIATPHTAGYSLDGKANGTAQSVRAISRYFGLPAVTWYPGNIAGSENPEIDAGCGDEIFEQMICRIFMHTCDLAGETGRLKKDPEGFERFRDNYPPRREFGAYTVKTKNCKAGLRDLFLNLGFNIS